MPERVTLTVNDKNIDMNPFVEGYVGSVVKGMVTALRNTGPVETLELAIDKHKQVGIMLNCAAVPLNDFVEKIIYSTIAGMVGALRYVDEIKTLKIDIKS